MPLMSPDQRLVLRGSKFVFDNWPDDDVRELRELLDTDPAMALFITALAGAFEAMPADPAEVEKLERELSL